MTKFNVGVIDEAEEAAEKDREEALRVYPAIQEAIVFLERSRGATREAQERLIPLVEEAQKLLTDNIRHKVPAVRRAVLLALLEFELMRPIEGREEAEKLLARLEEREYIKQDSAGYLQAYGKTYTVPLFGEPEKEEVKILWRSLLRRAREGFLTRGNRNLKDLFSGKPGEYTMQVPPELTKKDGKPVWRGGGVLQIRSDGRYVAPEDAMGQIDRGIHEAKSLNVRLLLRSLGQPKPPFIEGLDPKQGAKTRLLWQLIKRAKRLVSEKESFAATPDLISPEEFFRGEYGTCLINFEEEPWEWEVKEEQRQVRIYNMFFLVLRYEKEGEPWIKIVRTPSHLGDFFNNCQEETAEGEKFDGCKQPLCAMLRAAYGRSLKTSNNTKKASKIAAK